MSDEPPGASDATATGAQPDGAWGSVLTCQELAAVESVGFAPVGQVFGAAVYAAGSASGSRCPEVAGATGGFGPRVEAMYQARRVAVDRMAEECAALGGHGVVGVRLTRGPFDPGGLEFTAIGTAVRAAGAPDRLPVPFTSGVSGQDFAPAGPGRLGAGRASARHRDRGAAR